MEPSDTVFHDKDESETRNCRTSDPETQAPTKVAKHESRMMAQSLCHAFSRGTGSCIPATHCYRFEEKGAEATVTRE
jgi:hypothetical protein